MPVSYTHLDVYKRQDLNKLPNTSSAGTTVGYQYDGLTEEDRFVQKVLREYYDKMYKENLSHSDPMAYIESKYCDVTSPYMMNMAIRSERQNGMGKDGKH